MVYEGNILPIYSYEEWEKDVFCRSKLAKWPKLSSMDRASKMEAYVQFQTLWKAQRPVKAKLEDIRMLEAIVSQFPGFSGWDRSPLLTDQSTNMLGSIPSFPSQAGICGGHLQPWLVSDDSSICNVRQTRRLLSCTL